MKKNKVVLANYVNILLILTLPMSIGLSPRDLEEKFESEFERLVPNKEESIPQDIKKSRINSLKKI